MITLGTPWGLAALAAIPVVIYFHRRAAGRRRTVPLASLWSPAATDARHARVRRRVDAVLVLRLLMVIAIALGLARPGWPTTAPRRHVFVLDASASMQSREPGGTRFASAVTAAERALGGLPAGDAIAIVRGGSPATVAHGVSIDRASLRRVLADLRAGESRKDLGSALATAAQQLAGGDGTIHVFSDVRETEKLIAAASRVGIRREAVLVHRVGAPADNVAIVALDAAAVPESPLDHEVFAGVANFTPAPRTVSVALYGPDGFRERRQVMLAAGERGGVIFVTGASPWLEVYLEGVADALPLDDRATLVLRDEPLRVLYASRGDRFIGAALHAHPGVRVREIPVERLDVESHRTITEDVAVIDGAAVPAGLAVPALVFAVGETSQALRSAEVPITEWRRDHPLLRRLDLSEVRVASPAVLPVSASDALARSALGAVARAFADSGVRRVEVAFAVRRSNLGQLPTFPIIVVRALDWLTVGRGVAAPNVRPGETVRLVWPGTPSGPVTVRGPDGSVRTATVQHGRVQLAAGETLGRYDVSDGQTLAAFAVRLLDPEESNVRVRATPDGGDPALAPAVAVEGAVAERQVRDVSRWPLAIALQLLSVEIWLLQRRARARSS